MLSHKDEWQEVGPEKKVDMYFPVYIIIHKTSGS